MGWMNDGPRPPTARPGEGPGVPIKEELERFRIVDAHVHNGGLFSDTDYLAECLDRFRVHAVGLLSDLRGEGTPDPAQIEESNATTARVRDRLGGLRGAVSDGHRGAGGPDARGERGGVRSPHGLCLLLSGPDRPPDAHHTDQNEVSRLGIHCDEPPLHGLEPAGAVDGYSFSIREALDLRQGSGSQRGYVIFSKGSEQRVVGIEGAVTTTTKDGQPNTTVKGNWESRFPRPV